MDLQLAGQVAIVTGAAQGMGRAIASAFGAEGVRVALVDRDTEVRNAAGQVSTDYHVRTAAFLADVTDETAMRDVAQQAHELLGAVQHVVHAAAIGSGKFGLPFWKLDLGDWDRVLRVNLIGAANVAHVFAPVLAEARQGTLLFLASVAGQIGSQTDPPYSASKAGVINLAQCAARDLAAHGVRVNTLCPGMVKTALNRAVWEAWSAEQPESLRQSYEEWSAEKIRRLVPLNRWQEPEDIAAMAVFLASPRARNVTGQTINVDGGYVMHW